METREYFEKVMQDYNQNRKGRSLRKYCKDEAVDYDWLIEFKKSYRSNKLQSDVNKKLGEGEFIALTVEENFVPEQQTPAGWQVERLILKSPSGDEMEIKCTNLFAVAELLCTACWFHARHRFVDAYISDHRVRVIILMMNYLFQIERESKIRKHTAKQRRRFRLKYSASIVGKLMKLLKKIKLDSSYGAMVQRAVNYVLDDEKAFKVFLQDGRVEMHNNAVERMFRHLAMGRRNWMHTGSHLGAENIAFMFSLFESCKLNDINFGDYIEDILTRLMEGEQDFMSLIPCNYNSNKKVNVKAA